MIETAEQQNLNLPGYTLSTRLGAGGYGEVWLAQAPGGLTKAVKFIYGSFHEKRAEHELRALQKIKDLRHPFLLSLERIEVVGDRLVIVTELAESSLKDRFDQCLREGLGGIPRAELLRYLQDAADALDFLSEKHRLQHLDVKPENLLLVAGHVKVADFGLVKDVGKSQLSLVGGLTPLYSAPEVFQGEPSSRSDQYSLAVLYQEMLTGALPFPGVTAAELTLQHLHDEPDLSKLPTGDRYVLARALAKQPDQRYASCSEMVAALVNSSADANWGATPAAGDPRGQQSFEPILPERRATPRPSPVTEFFDEKLDGPRKEVSPSMLLDWEPPADEEIRNLPPVEFSAEPFTAQPTLVIGIGGTAGMILRRLRGRLSRQFGDNPLPAVQLLLLDSDPKAIAQAMQGDSSSALSPEETLSLPLRRPQEYREQSSRLMRWLSRRWLYNIPKSLRTDGLRPLGRLAFADHARQAVQRLRMSLAHATDEQSIRTSSQHAGLRFRGGTARVYVVASISGGAGSGMSLDVGYAIRTALGKAGIADAQVIGIFLQTTGRDVRQCDLARVNAYAWLTEYNHFHQPGGAFPGDESCGLPALSPGERAFDNAYLISLGAELQTHDFEEAAQSIAEYVFADALTPAQHFFDKCREEGEDRRRAAAPLRTFRLETVGAVAEHVLETAAARVGREVLMRWAGNQEAAPASKSGPLSSRDTDQIVQGAATLVSQTQLKLEGLASNARTLIEGQFGGDQQAFLAGVLDIARQDGRLRSPSDSARIIDGLFAPPAEQLDGFYVLQRPLEAILSPLIMKLESDLYRWVLAKLDDRQQRLPGAQRAAQWLVDHLTSVDADASRLAGGLGRQTAAMAEELRRESGKEIDESAWQRIVAYFRMRIDQQSVLASAIIARRLLAELKSIGSTIAEFGRHLKSVAAMASTSDQSAAATATGPLMESMAACLGALVEEVDHQIQQQFVASNGGLFQTIMGNSRVRTEMLALLGRLSRRAVEHLASQPEIVQRTLQGGEGGAMTELELPVLLRHGGAYRSLVILPEGTDAAATFIGRGLSGSPTVMSSGSDVILCYEAWDVPLVRTAIDLIERRRDYADFAARVATRSDVPWTPLTLNPAAPSCPSFSTEGGLAASAPIVTQVL